MSTTPRQQSQQTPTTAPARLRGPRRTQRGEAVSVEAPRYADLGNGSRFEFALAGAAMVTMWVSLIAAIVSL